MKVFITGASGFIGSATTTELLKHGHEVIGLARNDKSAEAITKLGASVHRGSLDDLNSLAEGAKNSDAVIHLAFIHEFDSTDSYIKANEADRSAIAAIGEALAGSNRPFIIASGTLGFPEGEVATEDSEPIRESSLAERYKAADLLHAMGKEKGFKSMVVRLAPTVHGKEDLGFIYMLGNMAKKNGFATIINGGAARWPATHRSDAATLFRLAVEKGRSGAVYNAIGEQGVPMKEIMAAVGKRVGVPVESKTLEEAAPLLGFFAYVIGSDNPTSSEKTKAELGWEPKQIGLLQDIEENYF